MYKDKESVRNLAVEPDQIIDLYAVWVKTYSHVFFAKGEGKDVDMWNGRIYNETVCPGLDREILKQNGYSAVKVTVKFDAQHDTVFGGSNIRARVRAYSYLDEELYCQEYGNKFDGNWENDITFVFEIELDDLKDDGSFWVQWSAYNNSNSADFGKWWLGETQYIIEAYK